jgi:hypothetical protein
MLEFLIDNIFVIFGGRVLQQTVGISMGTIYAPLLADMLLYLYKSYSPWINKIFLHDKHNANAMNLNINLMCIWRKTDEKLSEPHIHLINDDISHDIISVFSPQRILTMSSTYR